MSGLDDEEMIEDFKKGILEKNMELLATKNIDDTIDRSLLNIDISEFNPTINLFSLFTKVIDDDEKFHKLYYSVYYDLIEINFKGIVMHFPSLWIANIDISLPISPIRRTDTFFTCPICRRTKGFYTGVCEGCWSDIREAREEKNYDYKKIKMLNYYVKYRKFKRKVTKKLLESRKWILYSPIYIRSMHEISI